MNPARHSCLAGPSHSSQGRVSGGRGKKVYGVQRPQNVSLPYYPPPPPHSVLFRVRDMHVPSTPPPPLFSISPVCKVNTGRPFSFVTSQSFWETRGAGALLLNISIVNWNPQGSRIFIPSVLCTKCRYCWIFFSGTGGQVHIITIFQKTTLLSSEKRHLTPWVEFCLLYLLLLLMRSGDVETNPGPNTAERYAYTGLLWIIGSSRLVRWLRYTILRETKEYVKIDARFRMRSLVDLLKYFQKVSGKLD